MATGLTEQKKRYRQYKAPTEQLPANYHTAIDALERYMVGTTRRLSGSAASGSG